MPYRGTARGSPSAHLPPTAFVSFIQNHDQIGNRAMGDRMAASLPSEALKALAAVYLLAPQVPMLFMGEEWSATEPFPYFCDFEEELNRKVREREGRLILCRLSREVESVFVATRLISSGRSMPATFESHPDVPSSIASLYQKPEAPTGSGQ